MKNKKTVNIGIALLGGIALITLTTLGSHIWANNLDQEIEVSEANAAATSLPQSYWDNLPRRSKMMPDVLMQDALKEARALSGNAAHDNLKNKESTAQQWLLFNELEGYALTCGKPTAALFIGMLPNKDALWELGCSNRRSWVIVLPAEPQKPTLLISCHSMAQVHNYRCQYYRTL